MSVVTMRNAAGLLPIVLIACASSAGCSRHSANFTGIWKANCSDYYGVQIQRAEGEQYAVTFCGISGCIGPGQWTPNSPIEGDPLYQVVSADTIRIKRSDVGSFTYHKCDANPFWPTKPGY